MDLGRLNAVVNGVRDFGVINAIKGDHPQLQWNGWWERAPKQWGTRTNMAPSENEGIQRNIEATFHEKNQVEH